MSITAYHFWSPTCGPCKVIKPAVQDLKEEFSQISWVSVNTQDDKEEIAKRYGVTVVPTIVIVSVGNNGEVLNTDKQVGTNMAGYYRSIRSAIRLTQQS